jgi:epoxyqueuosine reductase
MVIGVISVVSMKNIIKDYSAELGFECVGFTDARPFIKDQNIIEKRYGEGKLVLVNKEFVKGCRPEELLSGAKSIISLAISYPIPDKKIIKEGYVGRISAYSLGGDYHKILNDKMMELIEFIKGKTPVKYLVSVDSGLLIDKASANRAGVGWYGKNTLIYCNSFGSRVFLGEILCDLELEPDEPQKNRCGECTLCLEACPTGALKEPFIIDPLKCISYLTQMKGFVPYDKRELIGNWIYGCDICQEVCPYNKKRIKEYKSGFEPLIDEYVDLKKILSVNSKQFKEHFGHTSLYWRGKNTIQRNAVIALGNLAREDSAEYLITLLESPSPIVRGHVPWALNKIGIKSADIELLKALKREKDERVIIEIKRALDTSS